MLRVVRVQGLASVQDLGREGARALGVPVGGAMDRAALRLGNALVGNPDGAAGIEVAQGALTVELTAGRAWIAVTGGDGPATLDGVAIAPETAVLVHPGQVVAVGHPASGRFRYLAIEAGIDVAPTLGSRSTYLPTGWGGFRGRRLEPGDVLPGPASRASGPTGDLLPGPASGAQGTDLGRPDPPADRRFRIAAGPQARLFPGAAFEYLAEEEFRVLPASDRMGTRLAGPALPVRMKATLPSEGTSIGAIQVPDDGQPIVLLRDGPTVGGYPKIGAVIAADLDRFCQAAPGESVRFRWVSLEEANRAAREAAAGEAARLRAVRGEQAAR